MLLAIVLTEKADSSLRKPFGMTAGESADHYAARLEEVAGWWP